jgi:hypothetical protein
LGELRISRRIIPDLTEVEYDIVGDSGSGFMVNCCDMVMDHQVPLQLTIRFPRRILLHGVGSNDDEETDSYIYRINRDAIVLKSTEHLENPSQNHVVVKYSLEMTVVDQHSCIIFTLMYRLWLCPEHLHMSAKLLTHIHKCSSICDALDIKVCWITNVAHCHNV